MCYCRRVGLTAFISIFYACETITCRFASRQTSLYRCGTLAARNSDVITKSTRIGVVVIATHEIPTVGRGWRLEPCNSAGVDVYIIAIFGQRD